jgi:hypothetical protein
MVSRVTDSQEGGAVNVCAGVPLLLLLFSNIAGSEERLRQTRETATKRKHKEEASGACCSTFVRTAAFAK